MSWDGLVETFVPNVCMRCCINLFGEEEGGRDEEEKRGERFGRRGRHASNPLAIARDMLVPEEGERGGGGGGGEGVCGQERLKQHRYNSVYKL